MLTTYETPKKLQRAFNEGAVFGFILGMLGSVGLMLVWF